jgi:hypothetical protein
MAHTVELGESKSSLCGHLASREANRNPLIRWRPSNFSGESLQGTNMETSDTPHEQPKLIDYRQECLNLMERAARDCERVASEALASLELEREVIALTLDLFNAAKTAEADLRAIRSVVNRDGKTPRTQASHPKPTGHRRRRGKNPILCQIRKMIKEIREAGYHSCAEIVEQLHKRNVPRPNDTSWSHLSWIAAFRDKNHQKTVRKWISINTKLT